MAIRFAILLGLIALVVLLAGCGEEPAAPSAPPVYADVVQVQLDKVNVLLREARRAGQPLVVFMVTLPDSTAVLLARPYPTPKP